MICRFPFSDYCLSKFPFTHSLCWSNYYIYTHSDTCIHDCTFSRYRYPTTSIFFLKEARIYSFLCNVWQIKLLSIISMASCSDTIWRLRVEWSAQLLVAGILSQMNIIDKIPVVQINPFLYFKDAVRPSCSDEKIYKYQFYWILLSYKYSAGSGKSNVYMIRYEYTINHHNM